ncbi:MAG: TonB-system energizer ExbB [Thermodesulfobacteriota bacterium]
MEWLKDVIDYGIIGFLLVMSVVACAIAIERFLVFRSIRLDDYPNKQLLQIELTKKLHVIAIIGSNAPYLGLLGTVLGIMLTFYNLGREGFMDTSEIMVGLALALKVTAVGLVVAIPAVFLYNMLLRQAKVLMLQWESTHGRD